MPFVEYFISKYDTKYWDNETGTYEHDEWQSIYDIGKSISGVVLTSEEYLNTEKRYSSVIKYLCSQNGAYTLRVAGLEKYDNNCNITGLYTSEMSDLKQKMLEGQIFEYTNIDSLISLILRNDIYCFLYSPDNHFIVSFTGDMYMYITCNELCNGDIERINNIGLFIM